MTDVATLGFNINSASLTDANEELQKTPRLAAAAEAAVDKLGKTSDKAGDDVKKGADKTSSASAKVLEDIRREQAAIGKTALEIAISNNMRKAGVDATSAQGKAIAAATAQLHAEASAMEVTATKAELLVTALKKVAVALGAAFAAKKFIDATSEADFASAQLENTLRGVGQFAGQSQEKLKDYAEQLKNTTMFTTTATAEAQTMLLMFTRVRGDVFPRAMSAAADLATVMKQDLASAASYVGKALQEPAKAQRMLTAAGISLTDGQQRLVDGFVRSGEAAKAQAIILDAIERRMQGAAKAARETLGGAITALSNSLGDLFEMPKEISEPLRQAIEDLITAISDPAFIKFVQTIGKLIFKSLENFVYILTLAAKAINWLTNNGLIPAIELFGSFGNVVRAAFGMSILEMIKNAGNWIIRTFLTAYESVKFVFETLPDVIGIAITNALNAIIVELNTFIMKAWAQVQDLLAKARTITSPGSGAGGFVGAGAAGGQPGVEGARPGPIPTLTPNAAARARVGGAVDAIGDRIKAIQSKDYMGAMTDGLNRAADATDKADKGVRKLTDDVGKMKTNADAAGDAWDKLVKGAKDYIDKQDLAARTLGMTAFEAARLKHEQELLSKATEDGRKITAAQTEEIKKLAAAMAEADSRLATAKFMFETEKAGTDFVAQQKLQRDALFLSKEEAAKLKYEYEMLNRAANDNIKLSPEQIAQIKGIAAAMAEAESQTALLTEAFEFGKDVFKGFLDDMIQGLKSGASFWQAFGNAALAALDKIVSKLLDMALNKVFSDLLGSLFGGFSLFGNNQMMGGGGFDLFGGAVGNGVVSGIGSLGGGMGGMAGFFAEGGVTPVGQPYLVGEEGPEVRVDSRPGMIFNQDQWRRMAGNNTNDNNGGNTNVTINQTFGPGVNVATKEELRAMGRQTLSQVEGIVIRSKERGGPIRNAFRTGKR